MKEIDLVERLNLLLDALYYDAVESENILLFSYSPAYPRRYVLNADAIIKTLELVSKIYLSSLHRAEILIDFRLTNYDTKQVFFMISFISDKYTTAIDEYLIKQALQSAKEYDARISIDKNAITIDIKAIFVKNQPISNINFINSAISSYHALIAYDCKDGFDILSSYLKFMGIKVNPKNDYEIIRRHIEDAIYFPAVIFIHKDILTRPGEFETLMRYKRVKKYSIVAICDGASDLPVYMEDEVIILKTPFTYDTIVGILNVCYVRQNPKKYTTFKRPNPSLFWARTPSKD
ncbi:hypothetical protein [Campylobacter mucosalis]|uniref:hypothetical protein n=1 Tax=Campylobacter mucosalis TaxID=202 RepID=UPI0014703984|nr:hypothetical protein [Campylobacter mucosalis]